MTDKSPNAAVGAVRQRRGRILYLMLFALVVTGFLPVWFLSKLYTPYNVAKAVY